MSGRRIQSGTLNCAGHRRNWCWSPMHVICAVPLWIRNCISRSCLVFLIGMISSYESCLYKTVGAGWRRRFLRDFCENSFDQDIKQFQSFCLICVGHFQSMCLLTQTEYCIKKNPVIKSQPSRGNEQTQEENTEDHQE